MEAQRQDAGQETARLRRCLNDLVSIMALPALWPGGEPKQIAGTLLDALVGMLQLTFAFVRLNDPVGGPTIEMARVAEPIDGMARTARHRRSNLCVTGGYGVGMASKRSTGNR